MKPHEIAALIVVALNAGGAHAALEARYLGGSSAVNAYFDTGANLTWLADANFAAVNAFGVTGISSNGTMSWDTAQTWIAALNKAGYLGFSDWTLPNTKPVNGVKFNILSSYVGDTDKAYNISAAGTKYAGTTASDMSYLYYNSLGNPQLCDINGCKTYNLPPVKTGPFLNVKTDAAYWSGSVDPDYLNYPWAFDLSIGYQELANPNAYRFHAWAVRPGDAAPVVPEPAPLALVLGGLGIAGWLGKRQSTK